MERTSAGSLSRTVYTQDDIRLSALIPQATDERGTSLSTFPIFQSTFSRYPISIYESG